MSKIVDEVLRANRSYASNFGEKWEAPSAACPQFRNSHLHGCTARSRKIRWSRGR